ncbi:MAG: tRNA-dihydrouridine synthase family protein [Muribaculaceae bacterium]|nr:tRNA-dihydrouridine synthase family protein [Muribaculaceae bacterium]
MKIYSAPLQGYTEAVWRNLHSSVFGGVDTYYTPFLRYERNEIRSKDIRDVERKNNTVSSLVPQIIASSPEEMQPLVQLIRAEGYNRVDINMGCSFILQVKRKRGAGILPYPDMVSALMQEVSNNKDIKVSVKMRLGWESKDEWRELISILNEAPLHSVTMHPRLGVEQYKKSVDVETFAEFYNKCKHPIIYNGDLLTLSDIKQIEERFPNVEAIMLGRGLLANPLLAKEYKENREFTNQEKATLIRKMHDKMYEELSPRLLGNTQFLSKMKPYWEYLLPDMLKKEKKTILKSSTIEKYIINVNTALSNY